jgi:hypothetical protein
MPRNHSTDTCRRRRPFLAGACALVLLLGAAGTSQAVDGRVEVRGYRRETGAGAGTFRTDSLWEAYSVDERIDLSRGLLLTGGMFVRRETLDGRSSAGATNSRTVTLVPNLNLSLRRGRWRGGLEATALRRDWRGDTVVPRRDENFVPSLWIRADFDDLETEVRLRETFSRRIESGEDRESSEHYQQLNVRYFAGLDDEFRYQFSRSNQDAVTFGNEVTYVSHQLQYRGNHEFAAGRGAFHVDARTAHFRQENIRLLDTGRRLLRPIWGGFSLDDTPERRDPLEDEPVFEPRLYDRDRDTGTAVDIGDDAPPVRDWAGDYRNLIFDFGDPEEIAAALIFVSERVPFPALMRWDVYVSDDPDGDDWGEALPPSAYTVVYQDLENERQGWRVTFDDPLTHRRIKFVNTKAGLVGATPRVTELEVYATANATDRDVERSLQHRLRGSAQYDLTAAVQLRAVTEINDRHFLDADDRLLKQNHQLGADWRTGRWLVSGSTLLTRLDSRSGRNTRANSQNLSIGNARREELRTRLSFDRTEDRSYTARHTTRSLTADVGWQAAPALEFVQKVSYAVRDAEDVDGTAHSLVLISLVRAAPRPNMDVRLRRSDRWVDREAGSDFATFNDTEATLVWNILPLVSYTGQVVYQVRDRSDWTMRNSLAWSPLRGGSLEFKLYASDYQDTRTDVLRRQTGFDVTWRPRPRLRLEAGAETGLIKERGERNLPVNLNARGTWTF